MKNMIEQHEAIPCVQPEVGLVRWLASGLMANFSESKSGLGQFLMTLGREFS
jgi:hypothetical protein